MAINSPFIVVRSQNWPKREKKRFRRF